MKANDIGPGYAYETTRAALLRLGIGHVHELAIAEERARSGWDLLIDYDRRQDVPGMVAGPAFWADESEYTPDGGTWALEVRSGEPDEERLRTILTARLARAGCMIDAWDFRTATNGWHLKMRLDPHPAPVEAVALQAICGSDPSRESCNVQRAREVERWAREADQGGSDIGHDAARFWRERWNVLYQPNPQRKTTP